MVDLYNDNHIFVFTSRGEANGLQALEAMACGLIVMAPPIGGMAEFINENTAISLEYSTIEHHHLIKTKAPNIFPYNLIETVRYVYEHYNNIKGCCAYANTFVKKNYCVDKMAKKLVKILFNEN